MACHCQNRIGKKVQSKKGGKGSMDCRTCEWFGDELFGRYRCLKRKTNMDFWRSNCSDYRLSVRVAIKRLNKRIRVLEQVHTPEARKDIEAMQLAVTIMRGMDK